MKIDKTEREFTLALSRAFFPWPKTPTATVQSLKELIGLEFKPEEPELPARVTSTGAGNLVTAGACGEYRNLTPAEGREAAARYNVVGRLLGYYGEGSTLRSLLHEVLAEERERLQ